MTIGLAYKRRRQKSSAKGKNVSGTYESVPCPGTSISAKGSMSKGMGTTRLASELEA